MFHQVTAKMLNLCKQAWPDIQLTVVYIMTCVTKPNVDDWEKLGRAIKYLRDTKHLWLMLEVDDKQTKTF
jgi:hypothetical protein